MQDVIQEDGEKIQRLLIRDKADVFICGRVAMARDVYLTLKHVIALYSHISEHDAEHVLARMKVLIDIV